MEPVSPDPDQTGSLPNPNLASAPVSEAGLNEPPPIPVPPLFSTLGTRIWSVALLAGACVILVTAVKGRDQLLDNPEQYLDRVMGRELDAAERSPHLARWQKVINFWDLDQPDDALKDAIETYQHFERDGLLGDSASAKRTLAVLLREAGRTNEAEQEIQQLPQDGPDADFCTAFALAYTPADKGRRARLSTSGVVHRLTPEWVRDKLEWRLALHRADAPTAERILSRIHARGQHVQDRVTSMALANALLVVAGLVVIGTWLFRGRHPVAVASGEVVSPWSISDGYAVLVRGAVMGLVLAACLSMLSGFLPVIDGVATVLSALPMLWLASKYLLTPHGCSFRSCFGLHPPAPAGRALLALSAGVLALMLVGELSLNYLTSGFDQSSLAESIPEELLLGTWCNVLLSAMDAIIWAPLIEEMVFRGLLYPTLRRRLRIIPAAALSSVLFGLAHGYSWEGFLVIWWSGFLWALAYEKSRSLWPGIICHGVSNVFATLSPLLIYRL